MALFICVRATHGLQRRQQNSMAWPKKHAHGG